MRVQASIGGAATANEVLEDLRFPWKAPQDTADWRPMAVSTQLGHFSQVDNRAIEE